MLYDGLVSKESDSFIMRLTSLRIDLSDRSVTLESGDEPVAKLSFSRGSIIFEPAPLGIQRKNVDEDSTASEGTTEEGELETESDPRLSTEKEPSVVLQ